MLLLPLGGFRQLNAAGEERRSGPESAPGLSVEQAVSARVPSDLQFSPDGKRLAFQVSELKQGGSRTLEIWVVDVASRQGRRFAHSSQSDRMPRWSPDGKTVGFLSNRDGTTQVYTIAADGGEAEALTQGTNAVSDFAWSPDGKQIVFLAPEPNTAAEEKKQKDKDDARVVGTLDKRSRLWTIELATKKVRQLTRNQWDVREVCWSPGGDRLYAIATENPDSTGFEDRILAVSLPDGAFKQVFAPVGPINQLRVSRDGGLMSFLGARGDGPIPHDIFVLPVGSSTPRNLTGASLDRQVTSYEWQADGRLLAIAQDGFRWRGMWVTATGNVDPLQELAAHSTILVARAASGVLAFIRQTAMELPEVWTLVRGGKPERVTHFNDGFPMSMLIQPEYYRYRSYDGLNIEAALYRPRARGKTGPAALIAIIHGGPTSRWDDRYWPWMQLLGTHGYAVFCPNVRGSTGYGWDLLVKNRADWCGGDFQDIMAGVDDLIKRGIADPDRLGIAGWSYGGQMAAWAPTQTTRFKAAVVGAPVTDMASDFGTEGSAAGDCWFYGVPYENLESFMKASPITYVKKHHTATLLLHGENDRNNPLGQSQQFYRALKHYGVECEFVIYPREGHGFREAGHIVDYHRRLVRWFETHVPP
jgi:dipeptidyl aminopeptidase/acylaminoacyl peptidase